MKRILIVLSGLLLASNVNAGEILRLKATGAMKPSAMTSDQISQKETGLYIVQWKKAVTESEKDAVKQLGFSFLGYIPDDAFIVKGNLNLANQAKNLSFVNAVLPYEAGYKMEPELTSNGVFSLSDRAMVSIQTTSDVDFKALKAHFNTLQSMGNNIYVGESSIAKMWDLAQRADVIWIERYIPVQSMDMNLMESAPIEPTATRTGYESGTKILNVDYAYSAGINGAGQILAFADTGLDTGDMNTLIPDFQGQVKSGFAMGLGGSSWGDPMNHGTHVAGSIAGSGKSSDGFIRGGAYGAKLVAEGMWSDIMNNIVPPSIPKLFDQAYKEGARLHSNSWGAPNSNGRYDNMSMQADQWVFQNPDFLPIFAAGNDGADMNKDGVVDEGSVSSPGTAKNVLTVGASKNFLMEGGIQRMIKETRLKDKMPAEPLASSKFSEDLRGMAAFSSRGPAADGRLKPEVVAPGTNIVAARNHHPKAKPEDSWGIYDDHYLYMGGTSMATPVTAGAMGLIRQYLLQKTGAQTVSAALMKAVVANTAEDLFPGQFGERSSGQEQPTRRPNNHEGWGRVNMQTLLADSSLMVMDERTGLATGQQKVMELNVRDTSRALKITMAYSDAAGQTAASRTLVNDLDLSVITPSGAILFPNRKDGADNVNNMEQVDMLIPEAGTYKVIVKGSNIPQGMNGAQPYALVISAGI